MEKEKAGIKCKNCGQEFEPTCHITRQKFCSKECRYAYNNAKRHYAGIPLDICPGCGDEVEQTGERGRRRRFCSDRCRVRYWQEKWKERRQAREKAKQICPNCGKEFAPEWGQGKQRRFCCDECRVEWWAAYHRANPSEEAPAEQCAICGAPLEGRKRGQTYCSRFCYLLAMDETHVEGKCQWCGRPISTTEGTARSYCSPECAAAGRYTLRGFRKGSRRISAADIEVWREKLTQAAKAGGAGKRGKRVRLVCGTTSMYTGLDGLIAIVRYHLRCDPYDGSVYVFRDASGSKLKYIEWDGQSFIQGKRTAQSGTYPWPPAAAGTGVEVSKKEFEYLLSKSVVPFKEKKEKVL